MNLVYEIIQENLLFEINEMNLNILIHGVYPRITARRFSLDIFLLQYIEREYSSPPANTKINFWFWIDWNWTETYLRIVLSSSRSGPRSRSNSRTKTISTLNIHCQSFKIKDLERHYNLTGHPTTTTTSKLFQADILEILFLYQLRISKGWTWRDTIIKQATNHHHQTFSS